MLMRRKRREMGPVEKRGGISLRTDRSRPTKPPPKPPDALRHVTPNR